MIMDALIKQKILWYFIKYFTYCDMQVLHLMFSEVSKGILNILKFCKIYKSFSLKFVNVNFTSFADREKSGGL